MPKDPSGKDTSEVDVPSDFKVEDMVYEKMVDWYSPFKLSRALLDIVVTGLLGGRVDFRLIEALGSPQRHFDYSGRGQSEDGGFWLDYVADVGDGFNSTFAVATLLGRPTLVIGGSETRRGEVLVMGGDQVYPSATRKEYKHRLVGPYSAAMHNPSVPKAKDTAAPLDPRFPHLFAIPGNHDWYDGLASFIRLFGQQRTLGSWQTQQSRSYFALELPHRWWLLGIDIRLDSDIDKPQIDYFCDIAKSAMKDGDRVILCTAEPDWIKGTVKDDPALQSNLAFLEETLLEARPDIRVEVRLAGDFHHYMRHESDDGRHNIVAGGGGAFLHPTHGERVEVVSSGPSSGAKIDYRFKTSFPLSSESRWIAWKNLGFGWKNPGFLMVTALAYALLSLAVFHLDIQSILWALVILGGFIAFTDTHKFGYRVAGGLVHGLSHLAVVGTVTAIICVQLDIPYLDSTAPVPSFADQLTILGITALAGGIVGSTIFGIYLLVSLNGFGRHANEAFSSLRIDGYKNFLRIHIDEERLTIYPIGLRTVPRSWTRVQDPTPGGPLLVPEKESDLVPHLIESPIRIEARPRATAQG